MVHASFVVKGRCEIVITLNKSCYKQSKIEDSLVIMYDFSLKFLCSILQNTMTVVILEIYVTFPFSLTSLVLLLTLI